MGRRGRERALACFTATRMAAEFADLYEELTGRRSARGAA
jgi:hypothetical protein